MIAQSIEAGSIAAYAERYGADATRYGLLKLTSSQDVRFSEGAVEEGRKLANKLWNVARLILANVGEEAPAERPSSLEERWILARLSASQCQVEVAFAALDFAPETPLAFLTQTTLSVDDTARIVEALRP